jgi:hypothetical protein
MYGKALNRPQHRDKVMPSLASPDSTYAGRSEEVSTC